MLIDKILDEKIFLASNLNFIAKIDFVILKLYIFSCN